MTSPCYAGKPQRGDGGNDHEPLHRQLPHRKMKSHTAASRIMEDKSPTCNPSPPRCSGFFCSPHETDRLGGSAKSRNRSFCVLRKSKTGNFSVVTLRVATLKIPGLVFFVSHQKYSTGTFGTAARKCFADEILVQIQYDTCNSIGCVINYHCSLLTCFTSWVVLGCGCGTSIII